MLLGVLQSSDSAKNLVDIASDGICIERLVFFFFSETTTRTNSTTHQVLHGHVAIQNVGCSARVAGEPASSVRLSDASRQIGNEGIVESPSETSVATRGAAPRQQRLGRVHADGNDGRVQLAKLLKSIAQRNQFGGARVGPGQREEEHDNVFSHQFRQHKVFGNLAIDHGLGSEIGRLRTQQKGASSKGISALLRNSRRSTTNTRRTTRALTNLIARVIDFQKLKTVVFLLLVDFVLFHNGHHCLGLLFLLSRSLGHFSTFFEIQKKKSSKTKKSSCKRFHTQ
jgi:hypothetical protein